MNRWVPAKVISGGQTGVDRAALDAAIELGIPHGGFCPRGRRAEDGIIPARYALEELATDYYPARTRKNILESSATLIVSPVPLSCVASGSGTSLTLSILQQEGTKPWHIVNPYDNNAVAMVQEWLLATMPGVLNVAGPRERRYPGICARTKAMLIEAWNAPIHPPIVRND